MMADVLKNNATHALRQARPWIVLLARLGYAARGIVYLMIGSLAALAAFHAGGKTTNSGGILVQVFIQPMGGVLLAVLALGLAGYGLWRLVPTVKPCQASD